MVKHSPEPWNVDVPPEGGVVVCDANGAVLIRFEDYYDEAVLDEDSLLVAAAPKTAAERDRLKAMNAELLEALKGAGCICEQDTLETFGRHSEECKAVAAAIAKAKGRD